MEMQGFEQVPRADLENEPEPEDEPEDEQLLPVSLTLTLPLPEPPSSNSCTCQKASNLCGIACVALAAFLALGVVSWGTIARPSNDNRDQGAIPCWTAQVDLFNATTDPLIKVYNSSLESTQGLAYDEETTTLWEFHTHGIRVFSLSLSSSGCIQLQLRHAKPLNLKTDLPMIHGEYLAHIGGVDFVHSGRGREIWLATHTEYTPGKDYCGALIAFDAERLTYKGIIVHDNYTHLDWVAFHPQSHIGYFGHFHTVDFGFRFDVETLQVLDRLEFKSQQRVIPDCIQSAGFDHELMLNLVGDDYQTTLYRIDPNSGQILNIQSLLSYTEVDGLTFIHRHRIMLAAFNRYHSREGAKWHSVIQYGLSPPSFCLSSRLV